MDGEFEAVGEERLQHLLLLQPALVGGEVLHPVTDGGIGLRLDVELVRINPGWTADDSRLRRCKCEVEQGLHCDIDGAEVAVVGRAVDVIVVVGGAHILPDGGYVEDRGGRWFVRRGCGWSGCRGCELGSARGMVRTMRVARRRFVGRAGWRAGRSFIVRSLVSCVMGLWARFDRLAAGTKGSVNGKTEANENRLAPVSRISSLARAARRGR